MKAGEEDGCSYSLVSPRQSRDSPRHSRQKRHFLISEMQLGGRQN